MRSDKFIVGVRCPASGIFVAVTAFTAYMRGGEPKPLASAVRPSAGAQDAGDESTKAAESRHPHPHPIAIRFAP
jgi:hypothetical protein